MSETTANVVTVEGAKLSLSSGDLLAVMVPHAISSEQRKCMMEVLNNVLPDGVKALILDGGITVAAISKE